MTEKRQAAEISKPKAVASRAPPGGVDYSKVKKNAKGLLCAI